MSVKRLLNLTSDRLRTLPLVILYITDGCNSRCVTCDIWKNPRRNMPMELVEKIVAACAELDTSWVLLSGGESMQHPQWSEIAQRFRDENIRVMLLTNGLYVPKQIDLIAEHVDELIVSLDGGSAETYQKIRGVDAFDLVLDGIQQARSNGIPVTTRTTVQRANFREIPQIIDHAVAADVTSISFLAVDVSNPFAFGARFQSDHSIPLLSDDHNNGYEMPSDALRKEDVDELREIIDLVEVQYASEFASGRIAESPEKLRRILLRYFETMNNGETYPAPPCNAPHFSTVIEVDGTLRPCYFLPSFGRMQRNGPGLKQAVNVDYARELRKMYRTKQREECARCVCPLYKSPRALVQL